MRIWDPIWLTVFMYTQCDLYLVCYCKYGEVCSVCKTACVCCCCAFGALRRSGVGVGGFFSSTFTSVCFCFLFMGRLRLVFSFVRCLPVSLVWWWVGLGFCPSVAYRSCGC